jgi:hypothetical protein
LVAVIVFGFSPVHAILFTKTSDEAGGYRSRRADTKKSESRPFGRHDRPGPQIQSAAASTFGSLEGEWPLPPSWEPPLPSWEPPLLLLSLSPAAVAPVDRLPPPLRLSVL